MRAVSARDGLALGGLVCTLVFGYIAVRDVNIAAGRAAFETSDVVWVAPALIVLGISIALRAWRWQLLFEPGARPPLRAIFTALFVSYFFNNILPARAGEAARIETLRQEVQTPRAETLATV